MKIMSFGDADTRWRWFTLPGTDFRLELYCPSTSDMARLSRTIGTDVRKLKQHVAEHWFRNFENAHHPDGSEIENTLSNRTQILDDFDIWRFVNETVIESAQWREEGNDGAGSA